MHRLTIVVLVSAIACNPIKGTQGMDVARADFTNGTTRHPGAYDNALAALETCAQKYVETLPNAADSLGGSPYLPERIAAPFDSLVSGVYVLERLQGDTAARVGKDQAADGIFQRDTRRLYLTAHSFRLRDELEHELGHALSRYYPALRNPPGAAEPPGDDHHGAFFRACVSYCPLCGY